MDTVNLDVSKHVLGMDMDVSEKIGVLYPVQPLVSPSNGTPPHLLRNYHIH